jgi:hypothetical protein
MPHQILLIDNYSEEARVAYLYLPGEPCEPNYCVLDPDGHNEFDLSRGIHSGWISCDNDQYTEWMHLRCVIEGAEMGADIGLMIGKAEIPTSGKHLNEVS